MLVAELTAHFGLSDNFNGGYPRVDNAAELDENARRIVACVNALVGVDTEFLERYTSMKAENVLQENARLKMHRIILLVALKSLIKSLSDNDEEGLIEHTQPMMDARAAVEAVEGKPLLDDLT